MRPRRVLTAALLALATCAIAGTWLFAATHPVLPGVAGCGWVRDLDARIDCLSERIDQAVRADGIAATTDAVDDLVASGAIGQECHVAWHPVGERLGRRAAARGDELPELQSTSWCTQGHDHGFLIGYLDDVETGDLTPADMSATCARIAADGPINCVHAFGHAFARSSDDDLDRAARDCRLPAATSLDEAADRTLDELWTECMSGAEMERALADRADGVDRVRGRDCAGLDGDALDFCLDYATTRASMLGDDRPATAICDVVGSSAAERERCMAGAARA